MADRQTPVRLNFARGIDNRSPATRLPEGAVRTAQNVDIYRDGLALRRSGITERLSLTNAHSGWSTPGMVLLVDGGDLKRLSLTGNTFTVETLLTDVSDWPMRYCAHADRIYATNGIFLIRILNGTTTRLTDAETVPSPNYTAKEPFRTMQPGEHIASHNSRLFTSLGNTLRWSEAFYPEHTRMRTHWAMLEEPCKGLGDVQGGLFIGMEHKVVFAAGDPGAEWVRTDAAQLGMVEGTLTHIRADWFGGAEFGDARGTVPAWRNTDDQLCIGRPGGFVQMPNADRIRRKTPQAGASIPVERNGLKQVLTMLWGGSVGDGIGFSDEWDAEVVSHNHTSGNP